MKRVLLLIFIFVAINSFSQNTRKIWGGIELGYGLSLSDDGDCYDISFGNSNKMSISSIRAILGYYITPDLSLGAAIGLNSYSKPGLNILPVFLDVRYHPFNNKNIQFNGDIGYVLTTSENNRDGKLLADLSVGYILLSNKKVNLIPAIGYNLCTYEVKADKKYNQSRHSVLFKIVR